MEVIKTVEEFRARVNRRSVGFVPTMGALHAAHVSLMERSIRENETTVVSIFVNPTQFNDPSDLERYPRPIQQDLDICRQAGVDVVFNPASDTMYDHEEVDIKAPVSLNSILEGACRPGHFDGVLRIVLKLLNIVKPSRLYLGRKDAQQLALIEKMVRDFFIDVEICPCELIREKDGLAMSSRNALLSGTERTSALCLSRALAEASRLVDAGERDVEVLKLAMSNFLSPATKVEYVEIRRRDFSLIPEVELGNSIGLIAAFFGKTRLIDNTLL
jgi:pantoate--beta-alanine ligase